MLKSENMQHCGAFRLAPCPSPPRPTNDAHDTPADWIEAPGTAPLSKHFRVHDFAPDDSEVSRIRVHPLLVDKLEELRAALGGCFLMILSGFRSPESLWWAGSPDEKAHSNGLAADVSCPTASVDRLTVSAQRVLQDCGRVECHRRSGYIHFEVHPPGGAP